jgi:hypothetical protein
MNNHDVADAIIHQLAWLKEEFALTSADFLLTKLWLSLFVHWIINHAVLVLLQDHYANLLN